MPFGDHPGVGPGSRYLVLVDGYLDDTHGKMAHGVLRFAPERVAALVDRGFAGQDPAAIVPGVSAHPPIVGSIRDGLAYAPTALLVAVTPAGGRLPEAWRTFILEAIDSHLDIVAGLHAFLADDPEFVAAAGREGTRLIDLRRPPVEPRLASGRVLDLADRRVVLTVGSDAAAGKMTTGLCLVEGLLAAGERAAFVATGQTGIVIAGWGVAIDRVIGDFMAGIAEDLVLRAAPDAEWIVVEGQGSIGHPAFSSVTLALLHGAAPTDLILCHDPARRTQVDYERLALPPLDRLIGTYEELTAYVRPARVRGIAVNTSGLGPAEATGELERIECETGLPAVDVVRDGAGRLVAAVREGAATGG